MWVEQKDRDGMVGHIVPSFIKKEPTETSFYWGSCAWGDASVIMPWLMYTHYNDSYILEQQYPSMKGWVDWVVKNNVGPTGLWDYGFNFGDWLALDGDANQEDDRYGGTDVNLVASAYLKYSSELLAKAADILGKTEDAKYYQQISDRARLAIQEKYYREDGNEYRYLKEFYF
jgi:alpha-L-rhamnosidase